ncbi:MAG TPA: hypothetical protein VN659_00350 [Pyrinomonadaceae bacterium]|jgi:hypothetical protein|nr:hypothetical protein [Pyrinomonadaceae bacterium]
MVTFLFTSVFVLGLLAIAIYFWQKPANRSETIGLPPLPEERRGLFSDFRVNELRPPTEKQLAEGPKVDAETFQEAIKAIKAFQESPNRTTTTNLLHIAALADDAKNYGRAVELVLMSWRDGTLSDVSARELQALFNSEYWVLSSRIRTSGAGFVLKETLSSANRELESNNKPI